MICMTDRDQQGAENSSMRRAAGIEEYGVLRLRKTALSAVLLRSG
jgi:hypothetical protein